MLFAHTARCAYGTRPETNTLEGIHAWALLGRRWKRLNANTVRPRDRRAHTLAVNLNQNGKMKFTQLSGDRDWMGYGAKFVSPRQNNGEFDYWLVIDFVNMDDACGRDNEGQAKYHVTVQCVAPSQVPAGDIQRAAESCGWDGIVDSPLTLVELLSSYGTHAVLWQSSGNNAHRLMRAARREAMTIAGLTFGFAMDRPVNRVGTTGWEAITGDIAAGIQRAVESGTTEGRVLGAMHGA